MRAGARVQAAIDILDEIQRRHRPAAMALADWGRTHRFAGSGDRAAIGNLVYDALRRRASLGWAMEDDAPRALALAAVAFVWGEGLGGVDALCDGSEHAPAPLSETERAHLEAGARPGASPWIEGDYPEWLQASLERVFAERAAEEGARLATRAPIDLRANTLKADRDKVLKALRKFAAAPTPISPVGVRIPPPERGAKSPHVEAEPGHGRGWFELQDEGSQIAALMAGAAPGLQVADLCAGSGGKTLALAAAMENRGQIYAYDADRHRLRPIFERLKRAGVRNAQVLPAGEPEALRSVDGRMDRVVIDAPCTGTGVWRRRPDAKWRLKPQNLETRRTEQRQVLDLGAPLVKPGGRLVYITCSVLAEENDEQVEAFLARHDGFALLPTGQIWREAVGSDPPHSADGREDTLLLTPASHGTDGFFIAVLARH